MVTGAYYPEISSGGLQSQLMAHAMADRVEVRVLTTAVDPTLPRYDVIEGVEVTRIHLRVSSRTSKLMAAVTILPALTRLVRWCDAVHIHGVSSKNTLVTAIAKMIGRPVIVSLHTTGADEPAPIRQSGRLLYKAFRAADRYLAVSAPLMQSAVDDGIPPERIEVVANGIDTDRFCPASLEEKRRLRREAGHDVAGPVILFVGYFSRDKQPRVLFDAWMRLLDDYGIDTTAWFVGATKSDYYEVDPQLADTMERQAHARGRGHQLIFSGAVHEVHRFFRLADLFVLPSRREGLPVALLEAMACGLPCVASRLPGSTEAIIEHGVNGLLTPPGDVAALAAAINSALRDDVMRQRLGAAARTTIVERYSSVDVAARWFKAYEQVVAAPRAREWRA
jgi:glycosyltransferase involved in cell wall biosynthesis